MVSKIEPSDGIIRRLFSHKHIAKVYPVNIRRYQPMVSNDLNGNKYDIKRWYKTIWMVPNVGIKAMVVPTRWHQTMVSKTMVSTGNVSVK